MAIHAFYINLNKDKDKKEIITKNLANTDLTLNRFPAILGSNISNNDLNKYFTKYANYYLTNTTKGCALSHVKLSEFFINKTNLEYILVLEDDAIVNPEIDPKSITTQIKNIINTLPKDWDILRLYCQGACGYEGTIYLSFLAGSTLAYIINRKGGKKMMNIKIDNHIDLILGNTYDIKMYETYFPLFINNGVSESANGSIKSKIFNAPLHNKYDRSLYEHISIDAYLIPCTNIPFKYIYIIYIIIGFIIFSILKAIYTKINLIPKQRLIPPTNSY